MNEVLAKMSKGPFDFDRTNPLQPVAAETLEAALRKISAIESVQERGLLGAVTYADGGTVFMSASTVIVALNVKLPRRSGHFPSI